ncbi:MAG TPA: class I SAM-dependent methyltransferase [Actinomycetota bacterium]|nr:class I SAM-dependent methyltransferase [Actinomycetota bacterium]
MAVAGVAGGDALRLLDGLLAPAGRALLAEVMAAPVERAGELGAAERLRARWPADLVAAAFAQRELRLAARAKFGLAERMLFTRPGLEQASAEAAARHRARRYQGVAAVADLCCGIGGDLTALAPGRAVLAVDVDPVHLRMAAENAAVHGAGDGVEVVLADARSAPLDRVKGAFVDPARRAGGRRFGPGTSEPPLAWCLGLADRVAAVGIKAAPGLPLDLVPAGWEVEFLADGRDLKEAALWSPALATAARRATVLPGGETLTPAPGPAVACAPPGGYLLDPNPAVTRAGAVETLARTLGAWKLDGRIAFLSADEPPRTPFGRPLRVEASMPYALKRLRASLRALGVGAVDIRRRGLAGDVDDLRRRLRLDGEHRATVILTRVLDQPWALVCSDLDAPPLS